MTSEKSRIQSGDQKTRERTRDETQKGSKKECRVKMQGAESKELRELLLGVLFPSTPDTRHSSPRPSYSLSTAGTRSFQIRMKAFVKFAKQEGTFGGRRWS